MWSIRNPCKLARRHEAADEACIGLEGRHVLHPDPGERIDVEEAAIVDLI
jgi:hypothetical protein